MCLSFSYDFWLLDIILNSTELKGTQNIKLYHFVHIILSVPICPIPFCPYHVVRYHFVRSPFQHLLGTAMESRGEHCSSHHLLSVPFFDAARMKNFEQHANHQLRVTNHCQWNLATGNGPLSVEPCDWQRSIVCGTL